MYKKTAAVMIIIISVWIYAGVTLEMTQFIDVPMPIMAIILAVVVVIGYFSMVKYENKDIHISSKQREALEAHLFLPTVIGTIAGISFAVVASLATVALVDADYRRELSSPFVSCKRDASGIKTLPVNQSFDTTGRASVTIHNVTYNVPQDSDKPQEENNWHCAEATLVEVSLENIPAADSDYKIRKSDFNLRTEGVNLPHKISDVDAEESTDSFTDYFEKNMLSELRPQYLPEGVSSARGWLIFTVTENSTNKEVQFQLTKSSDITNEVKLPDYK